jgi:DNA processing protein
MLQGLTTLSPMVEMGAYECLWANGEVTFKRLAERFRSAAWASPSDLVPWHEAEKIGRQVAEIIQKRGITHWGIRLNGTGDYPTRLRDAKYPLELLYFQGDWELVDTPSVAVVGTREPSEEGRRRTRKIAKLLVQNGYTVVSGLAKGVDTEAHTSAIEAGGHTIAVIGTPLTEVYPKENKDLQERIAREHLLISQIPILRYQSQTYKVNRLFFPERNVTMSALTQATIIVEAGETSGTLIQARAALEQKRKLFILDSCFQAGFKWPFTYLERGARRVREFSDILEGLRGQDTEN